MQAMRPASGVLCIFCLLLFLGSLLLSGIAERRTTQAKQLRYTQLVVADLALSDLVLNSEARYTRHPAVTDAVVVGMDHPGGLDHFPSTLFFAPVR
jgi:hypothetical protein